MTPKRIVIAVAALILAYGTFLVLVPAEIVDMSTGNPEPIGGEVARTTQDTPCDDAPVGVTVDCQVLLVETTIPQGTSVRRLISKPTEFMRAAATKSDEVDPGVISQVYELEEFAEQQVERDVNPGEHLNIAMFTDS